MHVCVCLRLAYERENACTFVSYVCVRVNEWVWDLWFLTVSSYLCPSESPPADHCEIHTRIETEFTFNYSLTSQGQILYLGLVYNSNKKNLYSHGYISRRVTEVQTYSLCHSLFILCLVFKHCLNPSGHEKACTLSLCYFIILKTFLMSTPCECIWVLDYR